MLVHVGFYIALQTSNELTALMKSKVEQTNYTLSLNYGYVYDTAWSLVLGLNRSLTYLNQSGLDQYRNNPYYLEAINRGIQEVNFAGLSVSARTVNYNKICIKRPLKNRQNEDLNDKW